MRLISLAVILTLSLTLAPLAVEAQQARTLRIGFIGVGNPTPVAPQTEAFRRGLRELGWVEGQTVTFEYRWAGGDVGRFPALAADLVKLNVDVIAVAGPQAIGAARDATRTIPVVFVYLADPVTAGFVASLARPGGNMTGIASEFEELITKQLQLLKEAVPRLSRITLLRHRDGSPPSSARRRRRHEASRSPRELSRSPRLVRSRTPSKRRGASLPGPSTCCPAPSSACIASG